MTEKPDGTGRTVGGKRREPQQNRHCKWYWRYHSIRYVFSRLVKVIITTTVLLHACGMSCLSTAWIDDFSMLPFEWTWGWAGCACFSQTSCFSYVNYAKKKKIQVSFRTTWFIIRYNKARRVVSKQGQLQPRFHHNCLHDRGRAAWGKGGGSFRIVNGCSPE